MESVLKFFLCESQIVEILVRTLESESSLHRRVDLFFLVDSIMQCSRGVKGNVLLSLLHLTYVSVFSHTQNM